MLALWPASVPAGSEANGDRMDATTRTHEPLAALLAASSSSSSSSSSNAAHHIADAVTDRALSRSSGEDDRNDNDVDDDDDEEEDTSSGAPRPRGRFSKAEKRILFALIREDPELLHCFLHQVKRRVWSGKSWMYEIATKFNERSPRQRSHDAVRHHLKLRRPPAYTGRARTAEAQEVRDFITLLQHHAHCAAPDACARCLQLCRIRVRRGLAHCGLRTCDRCDASLPHVLDPIDARALLQQTRRENPGVCSEADLDAPLTPSQRQQQRRGRRVVMQSSNSSSTPAMASAPPLRSQSSARTASLLPGQSLLEQIQQKQLRDLEQTQASASFTLPSRMAASQQQQQPALDMQLLSIIMQSPQLSNHERVDLLRRQQEMQRLAEERHLEDVRRQQLLDMLMLGKGGMQQQQQPSFDVLGAIRAQQQLLQQQQTFSAPQLTMPPPQQQQQQKSAEPTAELLALQQRLQQAVAAQQLGSANGNNNKKRSLEEMERDLAGHLEQHRSNKRANKSEQ